MVFEETDGSKHEVPSEAKASMNFWCFHPSIFNFLESKFKEFLEKNISNPKSEYLIPYAADQYIKERLGIIKVIPTSSQWFGVTYKEDAPVVQRKLNELVQKKEYPKNLWEKELV
jgi:hypothetical protein